MWIFTRQGFISVKQHRDNPDLLIVRARARGDLEKMLPGCTVVEGNGTDYRFRANVSRSWLAAKIHNDIMSLNYTDGFKMNIDDHYRRGPYYFRVWEAMADMQDILELTEKVK